MKKWQKILFGEFTWKRVIRSILSIYIILLVVAVSLGDYFIFIPPPPSYSKDNLEIEILSGESEKTPDIATLYLKAEEGMPTLLWSHGNAEDLGYIRPLLLQINELGYGVFAYDYPGYGLSTGKPSDHACYRTIERVHTHLSSHHEISDSDIIAVGQSVGSGPACYLAEKKEFKGLILISPLKSVYRVAFNYPIFPRDRFPNIDRISNIHEPLLVIHGECDEIIPHSHGAAIAAKHQGFTTFKTLNGRKHNDIVGTTPEEVATFLKAIQDFTATL